MWSSEAYPWILFEFSGPQVDNIGYDCCLMSLSSPIFIFIFTYWDIFHEGRPRKLEFIYKKCVFILTCLNFDSAFDATHLSRHFCCCSKVFKLIDFDAFYCVCCFLFHLFHIGKTFPFEYFLHLGHLQKLLGVKGDIGWIGRVGQRGHAVFG